MHRPRFRGVFVEGGCVGLKIPGRGAKGSAVERARPERVPAPRLDPERLGRGVLEMSPLALPAVAPLGREAPGGQLPHAQPQYCRRVKLDPSCTPARDYALRWGFRGLLATNIFALPAT